MASAVQLRTDYSAQELRQLAEGSDDVNQSRRLLSVAAVLDGKSREDAAELGCVNRQTLRDWIRRFNAAGPQGLNDARYGGPEPRLSAAQKTELAELVEMGPDPLVDGVVRWRRVDLKRVIKRRFGVDCHERHVGKLLEELGFSEIGATPHHPARDARVVEESGKLRAHAERSRSFKKCRAIHPHHPISLGAFHMALVRCRLRRCWRRSLERFSGKAGEIPSTARTRLNSGESICSPCRRA